MNKDSAMGIPACNVAEDSMLLLFVCFFSLN